MGALQLRLAADHPAARGHFPGNPIIPGAVLLSEALRHVAGAVGLNVSRCTVTSAKFPAPSRPGDCVDIEYSISGARLSLVCSVLPQRVVLKAEIACSAGEGIACSASEGTACSATEIPD
jgi:3-hydroxymyristoyl/3-hydroxydecanoyl-(acyl carrier protein) dehydratase